MDERTASSERTQPQEEIPTRALSGASSVAETLEQPKKRKVKRRSPPPMSEIAQTYFETITVEREVVRKPETVEPQGWFTRAFASYGDAYSEPHRQSTSIETIRETKYVFFVIGVGPSGRYIVGESEPFGGKMQTVYRKGPRGLEVVAYECVRNDADARDALNTLLSRLWSEGWQPTSFGQAWHDIRLRRVVIEPRRKRTTDQGS